MEGAPYNVERYVGSPDLMGDIKGKENDTNRKDIWTEWIY